MVGVPSPKRCSRLPQSSDEDVILSGSIRSASYNIVFQVLIRLLTFGINAFILRYIQHDILGICNVRLALLYSTILFLSREPFRRACLRKTSEESWNSHINLVWLNVPVTAFWSIVFGYIWTHWLSQPENEGDPGSYTFAVFLICLSTIVDSSNEVCYIVGQYFLHTKLRILGDTTLIIVRSSLLCLSVIYYPSSAIFSYALGNFLGSLAVAMIYCTYFYYRINIKKDPNLPFRSIAEFLPDKKYDISEDSATLAWSFFKQGILKHLLTEGERIIMTFLDVLSFQEQGVYDVVSNLGSLAARFVFLPIEESSYFYFAQTLQKQKISGFLNREKNLAEQVSTVLANLVRLMFIIGCIGISYGIPYSGSLLWLYGGTNLSSSGTRLLQANCIYIFVMAINGVTETFTFAAMNQEQMDRFNKRLVIFSGIFLLCSYIFTALFGSIGFFLANTLNMSLRVGQSVSFIQKVFIAVEFNPFQNWIPSRMILSSFFVCFLCTSGIVILLDRFISIGIGLLIFSINSFLILKYEYSLISFFINMYKAKKTA